MLFKHAKQAVENLAARRASALAPLGRHTPASVLSSMDGDRQKLKVLQSIVVSNAVDVVDILAAS